MPLPVIFGPLNNPSLGQLDTNFAVVGLLGNQGCTVAGTNTLVLTPAATNPTVTAYANYIAFSAIAAHTNTGAVTAQVGSLAALSVYKDSAAGPVVLTGNEFIQNCYFELLYDSTLNSNAGGFHLRASGSSTGNPISPSSINSSGPATATALDITGPGTLATLLVTGGGSIASAATVGTLLSLGGASIANVGSVGTLTVNGGAPVTRIITSSTTVTFTVIVANATQDATVAVAGVQIGDAVIVGPPVAPTAGLIFQGRVLAAGSIGLRAANLTGASITAPTGIYRLVAMGFT